MEWTRATQAYPIVQLPFDSRRDRWRIAFCSKLTKNNECINASLLNYCSAYQFSVPCTLFHPHTQRTPHQVTAGWSLLVSCHHFEVQESFPIHTPALNVRQTMHKFTFIYKDENKFDFGTPTTSHLHTIINFTHFSWCIHSSGDIVCVVRCHLHKAVALHAMEENILLQHVCTYILCIQDI